MPAEGTNIQGSLRSTVELKGRVALVTGASRGIGRGVAIELGARGADVIVNYAKERTKALGVTKQVEGLGPRAIVVEGDISSEEDVAAMREMILKEFPQGVDILVNNAGIHQHLKSWELKPEDWRRVLEVNLSGPFHCSRAFMPEMKERRWGRVVNISSIVGLTGTDHEIHYGSSKAALLGFTKSLARELAPWNITVNAVAPGTVETDMTAGMTKKEVEENLRLIPLGRLGRPEDIGHAVAFLASPRSSWITGQTLHVNGGEYMG